MFEKNTVKNLALNISNLHLKNKFPLVVMCIGSDKIVGDMLGVIVGERLSKLNLNNIYVYGGLDRPITQRNIKQTYDLIKRRHPLSKVVVVDSVLGECEEVGSVKTFQNGVHAGGQFGEGTFVGDYSVLGVVCPRGINALSFLSSVRVSVIKKLSDVIVDGFVLADKYKLAL